MSAAPKAPWVIFDSASRKYFCCGAHDITHRGWHKSSKDATTFDTRAQADAAKATINVARRLKATYTIIPAPKLAQEIAESFAPTVETQS